MENKEELPPLHPFLPKYEDRPIWVEKLSPEEERRRDFRRRVNQYAMFVLQKHQQN